MNAPSKEAGNPLRGRARSATRGLVPRRLPHHRSLLVIALGFVLFQVIFLGFASSSPWFTDYLEWTAEGAARGLRLTGLEVVREGTTLSSAHSSLAVRAGCDGIQPIGLLVIFLLCVPRAWSWRVGAVLLGVPLFLVLNWIRLGTLFLIQEHLPSLFNTAHYAIWPVTFLLLTLLFVSLVLQLSPAAKR